MIFSIAKTSLILLETSEIRSILWIASLRALVRILAMQRHRSTEGFLRRLETEIDRDERDQILDISFLPETPLLKRVLKILASSDDEDKERALRPLKDIANRAEAEVSKEHEPKGTEKAFKVIVSPLRVSHYQPLNWLKRGPITARPCNVQ